MRHFHQFVLVLLVSTCLAAAPHAHAQDVAPAPADEPLKLSARPVSINYGRNFTFDEAGKVQNDSRNFSMQVRCDYPAGVEPLAYQLSAVEITTDTGAKMSPDIHPHFQEIHRHAMHRDRALNLSFNLQSLPGGTRVLRRIEGTARLRVGDTPRRRAVLGSYAEIRGKRVKIAELPHLLIQIDPANVEQVGNRVTIAMDGFDTRFFDEVKFLDAAGRELNVGGWGGSGRPGGAFQRSYSVALPNDGQIAFTFWKDVREIDARFVIKDVQVPELTPDEPARHDLVIHAEPEELAAVEHFGELNVVIE